MDKKAMYGFNQIEKGECYHFNGKGAPKYLFCTQQSAASAHFFVRHIVQLDMSECNVGRSLTQCSANCQISKDEYKQRLFEVGV